MSGGPDKTTTINRNLPPAYAQGFGKSLLSGAFNQFLPGGQVTPYPNPPQQVMGFTPDQILGQNQATAIAAQGSPVPGAALQNALATQSGQYLDPSSNPWLAATANAAAANLINQYMFATQPSIQSQFAQAGNFGSSAQADAQDMARFSLGQNLANTNAQIYGNNYAQERQNQLTQQGMLPSLLGTPFIDPQMLQQIGAQQQQFGQNVLNTNYQNMVNMNQWPFTIYDQLSRVLPASIGNTGTQITTQPNPASFTSTGQTLGGAGMAGAGLLGLLFGPG